MKHIQLFESFKKGSPEELIELLKELPVDETAKELTHQILSDLNNYYDNDIKIPYDKKYLYTPDNGCLKPYELNIHYLPSNNDTNIGDCSEHDIQIKYINKDCRNFGSFGNRTNRIKRTLYNMIKHECSHFYLSQKDVEVCLYHTHDKGLNVYYQDRQEMVLHSREIFDDFIEDNPKWKTYDISRIERIINDKVKRLRETTNVYAPYGGGLQKKYFNFIMNNYIKPALAVSENKYIKKFEDIAGPPMPYAGLIDFARYFICPCNKPFISSAFIEYCPNCHKKTKEITEKEYLGIMKSQLPTHSWEEFKKQYFQYMKYSLVPFDMLNHSGEKTEYSDEDDNYGYSEPK